MEDYTKNNLYNFSGVCIKLGVTEFFQRQHLFATYAVVPECDFSCPGDTSGGLSYSCFTRREGERAGGSLAGWLGVRATKGKQHDSGSGGLWWRKSALGPSPAHAAHHCRLLL